VGILLLTGLLGGETPPEEETLEGYVRLIPFQVSADEAYMIEIGHEYMRFYNTSGDQSEVSDSVDDYDPTAGYVPGYYARVGPYLSLYFNLSGEDGYLHIAAPYGQTAATGIQVECVTAGDDTLAVTSAGDTITISLADTTPEKNAASLIQDGINDLATVNGVDVSDWTVTENLAYAADRPTGGISIAAAPLGGTSKLFRCLQTISSSAGTEEKNIANIQKIYSGTQLLVTCYGHGFWNDDFVAIDEVQGMTEVNDEIFIVNRESADTFKLRDINPAGYGVYTSGGRVATASTNTSRFPPTDTSYWEEATVGETVEIETPYDEDDIFQIDARARFKNELYLFHHLYPPMKLIFDGAALWRLVELDIFGGELKYIDKIHENSSHHLRVHCQSHGFHDGDEVLIDDVEGMTQLNGNTYTVGDAKTNTFFLYDSDGNLVDATAYDDYTGGGTITKTERLFYEEGEYPACGTFFEQRLCIGGSDNDPQTVHASRPGTDNFENFIVEPTVDDSAIEYTLVSEDQEKILWMVGQDFLMVGSTSGIWKVGGSTTGEPMTVTSIACKKQSNVPVAQISPAVTADAIMFVSASQMMLGRVIYSLEADKWVVDNMTRISRHITMGETLALSGIVQLAWQKEPLPILWAVRADGQLLGLLYEPQEKIFAWFRMVTDGYVESVAVVSLAGEEDQVWLVVQRTIGASTCRYIERFSAHEFFGDLEDCFYVHSGVTYDAGADKTITDITQADPAVVTSVSHGFANNDKIHISSVEGMTEVNIEDPTDGSYYTVANKTDDTFELAGVDSSLYTAYTSGGVARKVVNSVPGLDHLENETVTALVDGRVHPNETVSSGAISLDWYGNRIHAGLPYTSTLEPMKLHAGSEYGTARGKKQRIHKITGCFYQTVGGKAGPDEDNLRPLNLDEEHTEQLFTDDIQFQFGGDWADEATICIVQDEPLPMTVLAIVPRVTLDED
jgi:hypothetical protein